MGVTKFVAEYEKTNKEIIEEILYSALRIILLAAFVLSVLILYFSKDISFFLTNNFEYNVYIILIAISMPLAIIYFLLEAYLKGLKKVDALVKLSILNSLLTLAASILGIVFYGLPGAIIGFISGTVITSSVYLGYFFKNSYLSFSKLIRPVNYNVLKRILKIGAASLLIGAVQQITLLLIRKITIDYYGDFHNGILQSTLSISFSYFGIIFLSLSSYAFPKISETKSDNEINEQINRNFRFVLFLVVPLIICAYCYRNIVVMILYSREFEVSTSMYLYQFVGEFFKGLSWVLGMWLVPKFKLFLWLALDIVLNINFFLIYYILVNINNWGIVNAAIAYMISYLFHLLLNWIVTAKIQKFTLLRNNFVFLGISIITLILSLGVSSYYVSQGYFIVPLILLMWFNVSLNNSEKLFVKRILTKIFNRHN